MRIFVIILFAYDFVNVGVDFGVLGHEIWILRFTYVRLFICSHGRVFLLDVLDILAVWFRLFVLHDD